MLRINKKTGPTLGPVNLKELAEVREKFMPTHAVRLAMPCQLVRVANEVSRQRPELREEAHFVVQEELALREGLADTSMVAVKGGLRRFLEQEGQRLDLLISEEGSQGRV